MNELIKRLAAKVTVDYQRLSIVSNPDGLLSQEAVRTLLYQQHGLEVVSGTNMQLRIHFELEYKRSRSQDSSFKCIYVTKSIETILPDMRQEAYLCDFCVGDLFPLFTDKSLLQGLPFEVLTELYDQCAMRRINLVEGSLLVDNIVKEHEKRAKQSAEYCLAQLASINVDWRKPMQTINAVSEIVVNAVRNGVYPQIMSGIATINQNFQDWIDSYYFATLQSNHLLHPKSVNKILPHLSEKYGKEEKVALLVVDGFAYWQYTILRHYLQGRGLETQDGTTLSWLPSITMLSRQAIFRGATPLQDYKQSPENERKLWQTFWQEHGIGSYETQYLSDKDEFAINEGVKRLAIVTVEMDSKMHSSTDYRDLLSLTENWCHRITEKIQTVLQAGYNLYLTTDHGSTLSYGWRTISAVEAVFLYTDGSRGRRHLIYKNIEEQERFHKENQEHPLLKHDNWISIRDDSCFAREGETMITHGGSHFMEVIIPFVEIKKEKLK